MRSNRIGQVSHDAKFTVVLRDKNKRHQIVTKVLSILYVIGPSNFFLHNLHDGIRRSVQQDKFIMIVKEEPTIFPNTH